MNSKEIKIGDRLYHAIFGWCKVTHPPLPDKCLVDLEADEIEYYVMGKGYVKYTRDKDGRNSLLSPISELLKDDKQPLDGLLSLKKMACNPTLTFWKGKEEKI